MNLHGYSKHNRKLIMTNKQVSNKDKNQMNLAAKMSFFLILLIIVLLAGCTGMTWEQGLEILDDYEQEAAYLKLELILKEQKADSNFRLLEDVSGKINRSSNDIAEIKSCLDIVYNKESDTSLIFFGLESSPRKRDTTYLNCCSGYREKFKLKEDDFETLQMIWDQLYLDANSLNSHLKRLKAENDSLEILIEQRRAILITSEKKLYDIIDADPGNADEFSKSLLNAETLINSGVGTNQDLAILISALEKNRLACLPGYRSRIEAIKKKLISE